MAPMTPAKPNFARPPSKAVDPALEALFASSAGPVNPIQRPRYSERTPHKLDEASDSDVASDHSLESGSGGEDESASSGASEAESGENTLDVSAQPATTENPSRKRKRPQPDAHDDLESRYFRQLADDQEHVPKASRTENRESDPDEIGPGALVHESLLPTSDKSELDKAARTVFLSNVSTDAITSKAAKKQLLSHLSSVLKKDASPPQSVVSLRFRSVPVATAAIPKRAAVITRAVMDATTKSANAYVVYSDAAAARAAVASLNGTMILDRHLRVDSVAHPAPVDHKRCVFVGNLGFVDDETVINTTVDEEGKEKTEKRKRTKVPMDVEEGLWRTFGKSAGKVESVRVVRDQATRVGKGIAYVQFSDVNSVESALLLDGKKFPPLLPRVLRVTRCKAPHKTLRAIDRATKAKAMALANSQTKSTKYVRKATVEERTGAGRIGKLLGRAAASRSGVSGKPHAHRGRTGEEAPSTAPFKTPEEVIEGHRASAKDGKPKDLRFKGSRSKKAKQPVSGNQKRRALRAANWSKKGSG
ncbi:nucleolar protein 12 [Magnaporthiopsis poae ATCC 64411]|uniref:Nucleolar protein 12 n=1 Tax=Magnaporthiopsis poae (strain ATCC 64411 / 73-15) TaxID=644358 RepID=A0A0C4DRN0_MAGP6|nr:nucleolar protein 12 [Magnaporthiopsis poae ATCC 64411]